MVSSKNNEVIDIGGIIKKTGKKTTSIEKTGRVQLPVEGLSVG